MSAPYAVCRGVTPLSREEIESAAVLLSERIDCVFRCGQDRVVTAVVRLSALGQIGQKTEQQIPSGVTVAEPEFFQPPCQLPRIVGRGQERGDHAKRFSRFRDAALERHARQNPRRREPQQHGVRAGLDELRERQCQKHGAGNAVRQHTAEHRPEQRQHKHGSDIPCAGRRRRFKQQRADVLSCPVGALKQLRCVFRRRDVRPPRLRFHFAAVKRAASPIHLPVNAGLLPPQTLFDGIHAFQKLPELCRSEQPQCGEQPSGLRARAVPCILVVIERGKTHYDHELHRRDQRRKLSAVQRQLRLEACEISLHARRGNVAAAGGEIVFTASLRQGSVSDRAELRRTAQRLHRLARLALCEIPVVQQPLRGAVSLGGEPFPTPLEPGERVLAASAQRSDARASRACERPGILPRLFREPFSIHVIVSSDQAFLKSLRSRKEEYAQRALALDKLALCAVKCREPILQVPSPCKIKKWEKTK